MTIGPQWAPNVDQDPASVISVRHLQGGWEEPISIDRPQLTPFPTHLLGEDLAAVVDAVTEQVQVAPDIPATVSYTHLTLPTKA